MSIISLPHASWIKGYRNGGMSRKCGWNEKEENGEVRLVSSFFRFPVSFRTPPLLRSPNLVASYAHYIVYRSFLSWLRFCHFSRYGLLHTLDIEQRVLVNFKIVTTLHSTVRDSWCCLHSESVTRGFHREHYWKYSSADQYNSRTQSLYLPHYPRSTRRLCVCRSYITVWGREKCARACANLPAGRPWPRAIRRRPGLVKCSVVVLVGPDLSRNLLW